jgi:EAL domain-containing protein (putative c-di-GMP-specific phosphodiesterase class I)
VTGINADPIRQALVAGMLHFATSIGVEIIAEGVETEAERLTLKALGVALGQGFLFGRPAPAGG